MDRVPANSIYSLYIINKAGGLIYQKDFISLPRLAGNDYLRLLSTFHSLHAITARGIHITPISTTTTSTTSSTPGSSSAASTTAPTPADPSFPNLSSLTRGITAIETKDFRLHCYPTMTGLKFVLSAGIAVANVERLLAQIYAYYIDYVLKNAFYELEMPIRCEQFDQKVNNVIQAVQSSNISQQR